ncbi:rhodanese-like domain-containing protein [Cryomorpha ignava]|uniref:Rhodanese-like domain-containing protein n=1 Tax=Cryomorpha ignava TaxID=101383 RepID=A0A7K3WRE3_9FLAO|nr:rhodanese-like domain-containing protein [Cryomorpha ignava]NEN24249.1 rhodanese-like domain-containing protein [Cryomorpha ignava]
MGLMDMLTGSSKKDKIQEMLQNGAVVVDVRSPAEFQGGHVAGSTNIPLQEIEKNVDKLKAMKKPVVLCCASGARSGQASNFLKSKDLDCENGGGWTRVNSMM